MTRALLSFLLLFVPAGASAADLTVSAAISLAGPMRDLAARWESSTGERVYVNLAGSNFLARQAEAGAPADLILTSDEETMTRLERQGLLAAGTRRPLLSGSLVVIVPLDSSLRIRSGADLASPAVRSIALADPAAVPAGRYAKRWLETIGVWPRLERRIIPTDEVRAAVAPVERGLVDAAVVYRTEAIRSRAVRIAFEVPPSQAPRIVYPVAMLRHAASPASARRFLRWLGSDEAAAIFRRHGFTVLPASPAGDARRRAATPAR